MQISLLFSTYTAVFVFEASNLRFFVRKCLLIFMIFFLFWIVVFSHNKAFIYQKQRYKHSILQLYCKNMKPFCTDVLLCLCLLFYCDKFACAHGFSNAVMTRRTPIVCARNAFFVKDAKFFMQRRFLNLLTNP